MLTHHEARNEMTLDLQREMSKVIDRKKADPNYYIVVVAQVDQKDNDIIRIHLVLVPEDKKPEAPIVGTMLYYVNNRQGKLTRLYVLPRDIIQPDETINKVGDFSDEIFYHGEAPNK